jgi:hypothetical protein
VQAVVYLILSSSFLDIQKINLLSNFAFPLCSREVFTVQVVCDRLPVGLVDGAPSLQLSGGLAGVHPVPVDGSLEESGTT